MSLKSACENLYLRTSLMEFSQGFLRIFCRKLSKNPIVIEVICEKYMNKKATVYFIFAFVVAVSAAAFMILREIPEKEYVNIGEYDIWLTETNTANVSEIISEPNTTAISEEASASGIMPTKEVTQSIEMPPTSEAQISETQPQFLYVNINTAPLEELMLLKGIGEVIGGNIINYRNSTGGFRNIEEIMNVNGIGEKTFSDIREHIYVENPIYPTDAPPVPTEYVPEEIPTEYIEEPSLEIPLETVFSGSYDLNIVTAEELMNVPGIDSETAEKIIELRTSIHYFSNVRELLYVEGMTEEKLVSIMPYLYC